MIIFNTLIAWESYVRQKYDIRIRFQAICCGVFKSLSLMNKQVFFLLPSRVRIAFGKDFLELALTVWLSFLSRQVVQTFQTDLLGDDD